MTKPWNKKNQRQLHSQALQGIVTANGFFSAAVFIGITGTVAPSPSIPRLCVPGDDIVQNLLFEVLSFSFYLVSSLIAQGMTLAIAGLEATDPDQDHRYPKKEPKEELPPSHADPCSLFPPPAPPAWDVSMSMMTWSAVGKVDGQNTKEKENLWWFRKVMKLSVALSVLGSFFLMLAMVNVIQLKLGLLSCGSTAAVAAVLVLMLLGVVGLIVFVGGVVYSLRVY